MVWGKQNAGSARDKAIQWSAESSPGPVAGVYTTGLLFGRRAQEFNRSLNPGQHASEFVLACCISPASVGQILGHG